jgi:uncharacterized protein (DUF2267 family)
MGYGHLRARNQGQAAENEMRHLDLGVCDEPLILFGGPYSNLQALRALAAQAADAGIPGERMICTGDSVAYCGAPARTVTLLRELGCPVVAGNCEIQLGSGAEDCGCGFDEGSACDLLSVGWYAFAARTLGQETKDWMAGLPDILSFRHHGDRYAVLHGGARDVARFLWPVSSDDAFEAEWDFVTATIGPVDHVIAGHCGIPFVRSLARGRWINAGVIGMPPHDGARATRYARLARGEVTLRTLDYDAEAAAADMREAGLPPDYREALLSGYWPSEDVLPPELRVPLSERGCFSSTSSESRSSSTWV